MSIIPYYQIPSLEHVYLEDSYVLSINDSTTLQLEVVLCESHPFYTPPKEGEQYCYKECTLKFINTSSSGLLLTHVSPCVDPLDGSLDYGNIDIFHFNDELNEYFLRGEWGAIRIISDTPPVLEYKD